ncbi:tetraspanin-18-like [Salvia splendens]|uniref:tetraspanin-18-like n=1 Tax=Salvia splendens TaxID=180675 RepID=UPI001C268A63|nr:tetraspanin-18-like [Salvia splendens]
MRTPCSHTCLAFILKFLNFLNAFVGVVIIIYSAYVLNQLHHHPPPNDSGFRPNSGVFNPDDALTFNFSSLPAPWFTYAFLATGILIVFISFVGFIGAEAISGCCLCFYAVLTTLFILSEVGLVIFIALDRQWEKDIPFDPTGELDRLWTFINDNADVFMWVGIVILSVQVLSVLLAVVLRSLVSSQNEDDDLEAEYGFRNSSREPLVSPYSGQASGSARGDSDIWSVRMREKYGLNTSSSSDAKPKFGESKSISS